MPLASYALCSVADVRAFLQKQASDTQQDTIIESLINRASKAILHDCEREFAPVTASATRTFAYDGSGHLDLAPYDLRSVTSIQIDVDADDPTTLTTDDYSLRPKPSRESVYAWLTGLPTRSCETEVSIAGAWGFASVPDDVAHACIVTVAIWMRRDVSAFTTVFNIDQAQVERPEPIPGAARGILAPYRHYRVA